METEERKQQIREEPSPETGEKVDPEEIGPETQDAEPADAGQEEARTESGGSAGRLSWEEILADPEYRKCYDSAVQSIVKGRLRDRRQAEERLERLEPVLRALEECCGVVAGFDAQQLAERLRASVLLPRPGEREVAEHLDALLREAESLRESVPDFDLLRELEDADFLRMTAPHSGITLADAYYARHRAEREQETARRSLEAVSRSVRSLGARPRELRDEGTGAAVNDPRQMSRQEREALKRRIREAQAQGRRLEVGE